MNIINFGNISIRNFKSVGEEVKFNYADMVGMSYVLGENLDLPELRNGVGKSVIFVDALLMVLFGQVANNVKNKELFHRQAKDNLGWIKLQMFVNQQEWNVHCVLNRSKNGNVSLTRALYKGEVNEDNSVTKSSMAQTMKFLAEEIIMSDADTFKNAVVLSTSNIQNFFQLPKAAKNAYMDSVFTLAAFGYVHVDIKKSLNLLKRELSSQREVHEGLKENLIQISSKSEAFISEKETELKKLSDELNEKQTALKLHEQARDAIDVKALESDIESKLKEISTLEAERSTLIEAREEIVVESDDSALKETQAKIEADADEKRSAITIEIDEITVKIQSINVALSDVVEKRAKFSRAADALTIEIDDLRAKSKVIGDRRTEVCSDISRMMEVKKKFDETFELLCSDCQAKTMDHFEFDQDTFDKLNADNAKLLEGEEKVCEALSELKEKDNENTSKLDEFDESIAKLEDGLKKLDELATKKTAERGLVDSEVKDAVLKAEMAFKEDQNKAHLAAIEANVKKADEISDTIKSLVDETSKIKDQIIKIDGLTTKITALAEAITDLTDRHTKKESEENPFESLVSDASKKLKASLETIQTILNDQRKNELLANIFDEDGVKRHIVSNIVASLNILIKKYLAEMGTDYTVIFDDKFNYNFYTATGECDYWLFSSGERRRLDMAVMLALRDILFTNGLVTNILIVDEVLDSGIDGYALQAVLNILKNKTAENNLGCVVISHRSEIMEDLTETFDRMFTVVKENGASSIQQTV